MSDVLSASTVCRRVCLRWLSGVLLLAASSAVAWVLVVHANLPWVASYVLAAAIGWTLYRLARVNTAGVILWCLAVVTTSTSCWALPHGDEGALMALCGVTGSILFVASTIVYLIAALKDRTRRGRNCACCNLALFTWIAWSASCASIGSRLRHQEAVQHTTETIITLHKLAADVESIRARLGRLPTDEKELVALRQKPMPLFYIQYQIGYQRVDQDRYHLTCSLSDFWDRHRDLFGWIVLYDGPAAPRRMQVILF